MVSRLLLIYVLSNVFIKLSLQQLLFWVCVWLVNRGLSWILVPWWLLGTLVSLLLVFDVPVSNFWHYEVIALNICTTAAVRIIWNVLSNAGVVWLILVWLILLTSHARVFFTWISCIGIAKDHIILFGWTLQFIHQLPVPFLLISIQIFEAREFSLPLATMISRLEIISIIIAIDIWRYMWKITVDRTNIGYYWWHLFRSRFCWVLWLLWADVIYYRILYIIQSGSSDHLFSGIYLTISRYYWGGCIMIGLFQPILYTFFSLI